MLDDAIPLATGLGRPVTLRRLTAADAPAFARHVAAERERLLEHLPWPEDADTPAGAAGWLGPYERQEDGRVLAAGAFGDGQLLGGALLFHHDPVHATIEIGCWAVAAAEGHGLAAAACWALIALARDELGVERIEWHAATGNLRSRRLADRLGFQYEGTLRSNYVLRGERLSTDVLSLVGAEIDGARP